MTTLVYDGDCGFCTTSIRWVKRLRLRADEVTAWQHADLDALGLTPEQCDLKLQWVADDGRISSGHEAVARLLMFSALYWRPIGGLLLVPPFSWIAARGYAWVSANRQRLPGGTPACGLPPERRPSGR